MATRLEGNTHIVGTLSATAMTLPSGCVDNAKVAAAAGVDASKLEHQHQITLAQDNGSAAVAQTCVVHVVYGATGTLLALQAGCETPNVGDATITVDLHVNGSSVLSAAISLGSAQSAYELVEGVISSAGLSADDVIEIVITVNAGTGTLGQGVFANLVLREDAA